MDIQLPLSAQPIIETLKMQRHPEGGWYIQTFKDHGGRLRAAIRPPSTICLERGENSHWHRVRDAVEVWHFYAGAPLALSIAEDGKPATTVTLGSNILIGELPQAIVPANGWQSATSLGAWTLVGCTVSPGFDFSAFEMAPADWQPPEA
jgi:predicted cupin superfamily sugar epimerase